MQPKDAPTVGGSGAPNKRVISEQTPFIPIHITGQNPPDLRALHASAIPARKQQGATPVVYLLGFTSNYDFGDQQGMTIRMFSHEQDNLGEAEFVQFKRQTAHDLLEGMKSSESGNFWILVVSRNLNLLCYFLARWLLEERRFALHEALEVVKEVNPSGITKQKYSASLLEMYGANWPPPKRAELKPSRRFPAVEKALTVHKVDPRLESLDVQVVGKELIQRLESLMVFPRLGAMKRITRKFLGSIRDKKDNYVLLPEPAGKRCMCVFDQKKLKMLFVDERIGFEFDREFPLSATVIDAYLLDDGTLVVSDMRVFEEKNLRMERYRVRQNLIKKHVVAIDPELFKVRPTYPVHEARWVCERGFSQWPLRGFSLMNVDEPESLLPVSYLWEFEDSNPLIVYVKIVFSGSRAVGQVARWPALVPVIDLGPITEVLYGLDGQAVVATVIGRTILIESHVLLKAQFVRPARITEHVWTFGEFSDVFGDDQPLLTQNEMLGMM